MGVVEPGGEKLGVISGGYGASVWDDGRFWGWKVAEGVQPHGCPWCHSVMSLNVVQVVNFMLHIFYHNKKDQR